MTNMTRLVTLAISMIVLMTGCTQESPKPVGKRPSGHTAVAKFEIIRADQLKEPDDADEFDRALIAAIPAAISFHFRGMQSISQLITDVEALHADLPVAADNQLTDEGLIMFHTLVNDLRNRIEVTRTPNGDVEIVAVAVTHDDPDLAATIANQLALNHLKQVRSRMNRTLHEMKKMFTQLMMDTRRKISAMETEKLRFMVKHDGINPDDDSMMKQRLAEQREKLDEAAKHLERMKERLAKVKAGQGSPHDSIPGAEQALSMADKKLRGIKYDEATIKKRLPAIRVEWQRINRETEEALAQRKKWDEKLRETQIAITLGEHATKMRMIQLATSPSTGEKIQFPSRQPNPKPKPKPNAKRTTKDYPK